MPNYGSQPAQVLVSGFPVQLFAGESPIANQSSISIAVAHSRVYNPTLFAVQWSGTPGVVTIMGAMVDIDSAYQQLYQSSLATDSFYDGAKFKFYRSKVITPGIGLTVTASN